jgi:opacity protein-like surface antigen
MKRLTLALAGTALLSSAAQAADQWTWLPVNKDDYQAQPSIALLMGQLDPSGKLDNETVGGLELSFNCPLLQPPSNRIRQQLSYTKYKKQGVEKIQNIELNPHYVVEISPGLEIGGGPGLGFVMVDKKGVGSGNVFAVQLGASLHYHNGPLFLGAEARYQVTQKDNFGAATKSDVNNTRIMIKVGYNL